MIESDGRAGADTLRPMESAGSLDNAGALVSTLTSLVSRVIERQADLG